MDSGFISATKLGLKFSGFSARAQYWTPHISINWAEDRAARKETQQKLLYAVHQTPIGEMFVAVLDGYLVWIGFKKEGSHDYSLQKCNHLWPQAHYVHDSNKTKLWARDIIAVWRGEQPTRPLNLYIKGTTFQKSVWNALMYIPTGSVVSYKDVAEKIGRPTSMRAVGTAVGSNPVSLLVPCHRVVQYSGNIHNYGWGTEKKYEILKKEITAVV